MSKKILLLQPEYCVGCHSCELACSLKHGNFFSPVKSCITILTSPLKFSVPLTCLQCDDPACARVCVTNALVQNAQTGVIEYDATKCIGCRLCVSACPFGNISYNSDSSQIIKCDVCDGEPECALFCPTEAITWVTEDLETLSRKKVMTTKFAAIFRKED